MSQAGPTPAKHQEKFRSRQQGVEGYSGGRLLILSFLSLRAHLYACVCEPGGGEAHICRAAAV